MAIQILMPALSPTMTEGTLSKWFKKEGDVVVYGDLLAEIETDKATMELEAIDDGVLGKIIVPEGTEGIAVNAPIAVILEDGEDASAADNLTAAPQPAAAPSPSPTPSPEPAAPAAARVELPSEEPESGGQRVFASPLARRIAADSGLDLSTIAGTGPQGRIVKRDVDGIAPAQASAQPAAETVSEPVQLAPETPIAVETAPPPLPVPHVAPALPSMVTDQAYTDIPISNCP